MKVKTLLDLAPMDAPTEDDEDGVHIVCDFSSAILARGERLYAFCGHDCTNDEQGNPEDLDCVICVEVLNASKAGLCLRERSCPGCPQTLFGSR